MIKVVISHDDEVMWMVIVINRNNEADVDELNMNDDNIKDDSKT